MIRYGLACDRGHRFDAWFRTSADYEVQAGGRQVVCPECGSLSVAKTLMVPAVRTARRREAAVPSEPKSAGSQDGAPMRVAAGPDPSLAEAVDLMRKLSRHVRENADNVGKRFPEEARKIHYGETEPRNIYGEATPAEARELAEEGVEFHPMPVLPEERN